MQLPDLGTGGLNTLSPCVVSDCACRIGVECAQQEGTRYGHGCVSDVYADAVSGELVITFVQPIYSNTGIRGVLGVDVSLSSAFVGGMLPSEDSQFSLVENLGSDNTSDTMCDNQCFQVKS